MARDCTCVGTCGLLAGNRLGDGWRCAMGRSPTPADDLALRLRGTRSMQELHNEAADRIEALQAEVARLTERGDKCGVKLSPTLCSDCPARWCRGESK